MEIDIFSIFVYILDTIEDGALKEKRVLWIFSVDRIRDLFSHHHSTENIRWAYFFTKVSHFPFYGLFPMT
jgi:hypothetical protein